MEGIFSKPVKVLSGVPQGSVLGPLLFLIYIDNICECSANIDLSVKFADDTKTAHSASSDDECRKLQQCIDSMYEWAEKWSMKFNVPTAEV